jgi:hypothetical protein
MIVSVPDWAPPGPPLTGASRNEAPFAFAASAHCWFVAMPTVLWSIQTWPDFAPSATPPSPR